MEGEKSSEQEMLGVVESVGIVALELPVVAFPELVGEHDVADDVLGGGCEKAVLGNDYAVVLSS